MSKLVWYWFQLVYLIGSQQKGRLLILRQWIQNIFYPQLKTSTNCHTWLIFAQDFNVPRKGEFWKKEAPLLLLKLYSIFSRSSNIPYIPRHHRSWVNLRRFGPITLSLFAVPLFFVWTASWDSYGDISLPCSASLQCLKNNYPKFWSYIKMCREAF